MVIKITQTVKGSPDGLKVNTYLEGAEYSVPAELGELLVEGGYAVNLDENADADGAGAGPDADKEGGEGEDSGEDQKPAEATTDGPEANKKLKPVTEKKKGE
jgi:hypothetical protein